MKTTLSLAVLAAIATAANGFVIGVCGVSQNFNLGDNECQNWTDKTFTYQSDAGCVMTVFTGEGCEGRMFRSAHQNQCVHIPFAPKSMRCDL